MATFGQTIEWRNDPNCISRVTVDGFDTAKGALLESLKSAIAMGWTRPKWYQWWRWSEPRWPESVILDAEAELLEVLVK